MFHLQPASSPSITYPRVRSRSTRESRLVGQSTAQSRVAAAPPRTPAQPRCSTPVLRTWPAAPGRRLGPARRACALRPQGPRWACEARPCSGPMPPGCRLHGVGFGSLNGRCGACPEDIFLRIFRTLAPTALSPSASQALALRRPAPARLLGEARTGGRAAGSAAVRSVEPRVRAPSCAEETWASARPMAGRRRGRRARREPASPQQLMARGPSWVPKPGKVGPHPPELLAHPFGFQHPAFLFLTTYDLKDCLVSEKL